MQTQHAPHEAPGSTLTTVAVIPGDGIGPEITRAVVRVLEATGAPLAWDWREAGLCALAQAPNGLPAETLEAIRRHRVALKGPTATPSGSGHKSVNVTIRKALDLYANVRPVRTLPGVKTRYDHVDLVIVRENIEDTYGGIEHRQSPEVVQCLKVITRPGSLAAARYAFELARTWGRKRVTCVHKANIHKLSDGLFLSCFQEVAAEYPDIQADDILVDNACMRLVTAPERFDVLLTPNLYGDILSDLAAGLVGGLGVAPAGNIGADVAVFEAVHGTAPDIAGQGLANPTALLLSGVQMLRYLGLHGQADRVEAALRQVLADGVRTRDLGGTATTEAFAEAIVAALPPDVEAPVGQAASRVVPRSAAREAAGSVRWEVRGVDVFVEHRGVPALPEHVGPFTLAMISNRGTKVYPGPAPDILLVDWHRCRYLAESEVSEQDVVKLLGEVGQHCTWMHVEKLRHADGAPCYSKAQGE
ncbi:MAG: isocitrate/isopropylmalate family dehydrogenase [Candidatus Sericytochromatia bacterium]|nr:isocitrate/isopropylmalate family dehydrogenase [Candidatus Sericytochromatia bacterium]